MKQQFKDLLSRDLPIGSFPLSSKIFDLGRQAEIIAKCAKDRMHEDGEFATIHASNVIDWMNEIAEQAQVALDLHLKQD